MSEHVLKRLNIRARLDRQAGSGVRQLVVEVVHRGLLPGRVRHRAAETISPRRQPATTIGAAHCCRACGRPRSQGTPARPGSSRNLREGRRRTPASSLCGPCHSSATPRRTRRRRASASARSGASEVPDRHPSTVVRQLLRTGVRMSRGRTPGDGAPPPQLVVDGCHVAHVPKPDCRRTHRVTETSVALVAKI